MKFIDDYWSSLKLEELPFPKNWKDPEIEGVIHIISKKLEVVKKKIFPSFDVVFRALFFVDPNEVKLVILGQDPYHNGSATGLCFDVKHGNKINPSLINIYKELENSGYSVRKDGNLSQWAKQGVLMLNTALTVISGDPGSQRELWGDFAVKIISKISIKSHWLLMGTSAQSFRENIKSKDIFITSHPSPLSAYRKCGKAPSFIGSKVFKLVNKSLDSKGLDRIIW